MRIKIATFFVASAAACALGIAGCTQNVLTPISSGGVSDITQYFWYANQASPTVIDSSSTNPDAYDGKISFQNSTDTLEVRSTFPLLYCIVNQDSIFALGFTASSVLNISKGSYLSGNDTEMSMLQPPYPVVAHSDRSIFFVGTDSGLFYYDANIKPDTFVSLGLKGGTISSLTINPDYPLLIAALQSGTLYGWNLTNLPPAPSGQLTLTTITPTPATQMLSIADSTFMLLDGHNGIWKSFQVSAPAQIPFGTGVTIAQMAIRTNPDTTLFAASSSGQIGGYELKTTRTFPFVSLPYVTKIYGFASQGSEMLAATDNGIYSWSGPSLNTWQPVASLSSYKPVTAIGASPTTSQIIFASNGILYQGTTSSVSKVQPLDTAIVRVGLTGSTPWVLTKHDFEAVVQGGSGLTPIPNFWPYNPGGLVLMRRNLFSGDSSWRAGTLVDGEHNSFAITGRVLGHLDSLHIQGINRTYPDVLVIRYANEASSKLPNATLNYWIVYYAKNFGPVMIDNYTTNFPLTGFTLDRREIGP